MLGSLSVLCCHESTAIDPPSFDGVTSVVVVVVRGEEPVLVRAANVDHVHSILPVLSSRDDLTTYLVANRCGLATLGLESGDLELLDRPTKGDGLPPPVWVKRVVPGQTQAEDSDERSIEAILTRLPVDPASSCTRYAIKHEVSARATYGQSAEPVTLGVAIDDQSALFGTFDGRFFRVTSSGDHEELTTLSTSTPHAAGFKQEDGTLWLVDFHGRLARGTIEGGFEVIEARSSTTATLKVRLDGAPDGSELFMITDRGNFERFDPGTGRWDLISQGFLTSDGDAFVPAVAWLAQREAFAVGAAHGFRLATHFRMGSRVEHEDLGLGALAAVQRLEEGKVIAASAGGDLRIYENGAWGEKLDPYIEDGLSWDRPIRNFVPDPAGFVLGRTSYLAAFFARYDERGRCVCDSGIATHQIVEHVLAFPPTKILMSHRSPGTREELELVVFEPRNDAPDCMRIPTAPIR